VSAELEEVVLRADPLGPEQFGPRAGHHLFDRRARRHVLRPDLARLAPRLRQRLAVNLPVRVERECVEEHEGGRDHVLGQGGPEELPQLRGRRRGRALGADDVGREPLVARPLAARHDHAVTHLRVPPERRLDLAEFDAEAANLDLMVYATEELKLAARRPAREVAGAVEPPARLIRERVGHELLGRQPRPVEVAAREALAADD
jgi:hypothetical protein